MRIYQTFTFDAAHRLPNLPEEHKCARLHGHTFRLEVHLEGPVEEKSGWVVDFGDVAKICQPVVDAIDHRYLNDIEGLENPTSERIAEWCWQRLKPSLPTLAKIVIRESADAAAEYKGTDK